MRRPRPATPRRPSWAHVLDLGAAAGLAPSRAAVAAVALALLMAAPLRVSGQDQLVWEDEYPNGSVATPVVIGGTTVAISGVDAFGVGSPGNFTVNHATRGAHAGYWESGLDATTRSQLLTISLSFDRRVESLEFSLLDIDTNNQFHDSITVVGWNGAAPFAPTTLFLGPAVAEVGPGVYSGRLSIGNGSADANVDLRFDQLVDSVTFVYGPGPNAAADPNLQVMGLSDLTWTVPCAPTALVSTTAELRAAVADGCVTLILMSPGLYDLTASGSGQLRIDQDKILRNVGGGEVVVDAAGASRVLDIREGIVVELDGLTITGGNGGRGGGIRTRADLLTIRNSTITGNVGTAGGGLFQRSGELLVVNSTFSGNIASGDGGGLDLRQPARLVHVTVANNQAVRGGGLRSRDSQVELVNSLVADNVSASGGQIRGQITSIGINLVEGGCAGCGPADLTGDPLLLPLMLNGGDSETHALDPASIARDTASAAVSLPDDQRGIARPQGAGYDLGAYEASPALSVTVAAAASASSRLPSNGNGYSEGFTVSNVGQGGSAYILRATSSGATVVVDSIRGPGLTFGAPPDSALTPLLTGGGGSVAVSVHYTVPDTTADSSDVLTLTATSVSQSTAQDGASTTVTVVRPFLGMTKIASVVGDTVPGAPVTYQMTVTNLGTQDAVQVTVVDSLPPEVEYAIGSASQTLPSGISATLEFDDGTDSWSYTPVSQGCGGSVGYDRCVRAIRWTLDSALPVAAPDNAAVFRFTAGIL